MVLSVVLVVMGSAIVLPIVLGVMFNLRSFWLFRKKEKLETRRTLLLEEQQLKESQRMLMVGTGLFSLPLCRLRPRVMTLGTPRLCPLCLCVG